MRPTATGFRVRLVIAADDPLVRQVPAVVWAYRSGFIRR